MKVLDLIRYIAQHKEFTCIVFEDAFKTPMEMINHLASIDPSWYDTYRYNVEKESSYLLQVYQD